MGEIGALAQLYGIGCWRWGVRLNYVCVDVGAGLGIGVGVGVGGLHSTAPVILATAGSGPALIAAPVILQPPLMLVGVRWKPPGYSCARVLLFWRTILLLR